MAAISTTMFAMLRPGDVVLSVRPVYGGTHYLLEHILPEMGVDAHFVMQVLCCCRRDAQDCGRT